MNLFKKYKYERQYKKLLISCYLFYTFTMTIKLIYSSQIAEVINYFKTTKSMASLGLTIYYFIYAISQLVLGLIISKINVKRFLVVTSILSAISFSLIAVTNSLWQVLIILGLNGVFQCANWGGINYLLSKNLPNDTLPYCSKFMVTGAVVGTALSYLISSLCVEFFSWKTSFIIMGVIYFISIIYLALCESKVEKVVQLKDEYEYTKSNNDLSSDYVIPKGQKVNITFIMIFMALISFLSYSIYYGLGTWIPSYLIEVHAFPISLSILITLIMPLAGVPSRLFMFKSFDKSGKIFQKNGVVAIILTMLLIIMVFTYRLNLLYAIIASLILRILTEAYLTGSSSYTFLKFKNYINAGTFALIVNSLAAVGAGIISIVSGRLMDLFGWADYYLFLAILCAISCIFVAIGSIIINKKSSISKWI